MGGLLPLLALLAGSSLDPAVDFEPGLARGVSSLESARGDPLWVEQDLRGYGLSEEAPWTFALYYGDGSRIVVPLSCIWFGQPEGRVATLFRRHRGTGRLVPFVVPSGPPTKQERSLPNQDAILQKAVPRFDPRLTPKITQALNEAQIVFVATGVLKVLQLQAMNPVLVGPPVAAPALAMRRGVVVEAAGEAAAPASRLVPGGGLAAHEAAGGHLLARHVGLTDGQLAARLAAEETIPAASSFSSRAVAEQAASEAIDANRAVIASWLKNDPHWKLELDYVAHGLVGQVLLRGASKAVETYRIQLFLVKDARFELGWRILTGFPSP